MDERPSIDDVARTFAKDEALPEWVIPVLVHFRELVGIKRKLDAADDTVERELFRSAEYLDRWLPMYAKAYAKLGLEDDIPECIETVLVNLPDLLVFLAKDLLHKGGSQRRVCAVVCAEIWRVLHGAIEPHSVHLQKACDEYWRACGQDSIGRKLENEPRNWERNLQWVLAADDDFFRSQIEQFKTQLGLSHTKPIPK
jgi:hypothetical protein